LLIADVDFARRVVADEHGRQARRRSQAGNDASDFVGDFPLQLGGKGLSIQ
jgi:hypothetical protein